MKVLYVQGQKKTKEGFRFLTLSWAVGTQTSSRICIAALSCAVTSAALSSSLSCSTAAPSVLGAGCDCRY